MSESFPTSYEKRLQLDSESVPGGFLRYFADGNEEIIHANQYVIELFECDSEQDFLELTQGSFRHFVYEDDVDTVEESVWVQVRNRDNFDHLYHRIQTKTGKIVTVADYGKLVEETPYGRPIFETFVARIAPESAIDWLTGLSGMMRFHELARMAAKTSAESGKKNVAIALDIMGMKAFNTRYGREEGDRLLCAFADAMRTQFGSEACSRFGEDHFYAFAPEEGIEDKVRGLFAEFANADFKMVPPARAGLYTCDEEDDIVAVGFDRAKTACDLDRTTWQSHLTWFTDEMRADAQLRSYILAHLNQAIAEEWIRPYYQPVVRSTTSKICEEEALARWVDPTYGVLSPDKFIPVLEDAALLHRLDLHIIDCVLRDFKTKRETDVPIVPVSVNISYRDLVRFSVAEEITTRADNAGVPHDLFHVEFTESAIHSDPELFMQQVAALHEAGFEVWMDDFGSGYSSLNVLQRYEFDVIKLDMEFLRNKAGDQVKARRIVAGIVQTAKRLGVRTLSEGVETEEQAEFLEGIGCDMLQGYLFSAPNPLEEVARRAHAGVGIPREARSEESYWNTVSFFSLSDFSEHEDGQGIEGIEIADFPAGVVEFRRGVWQMVRDNRALGEFLEKKGILARGHSGLRINKLQKDFDPEFYDAVRRSTQSGTWELIAGRLEYGSGFQFYVKPLASSSTADAFAIVGVPTMLGTALGSYGDVPVAYAVFRVILNITGDRVVDTEYVYTNDLYRSWLDGGDKDLTGLSFLETVSNASDVWFPYCYRAAVLGETVHDIIYSPEIDHWISFNLAPSPVKNCCVYAFAFADQEQHEREEMKMGLDTSDLIIRIANVLNSDLAYEEAMNKLLVLMSGVIHPDRLYVFERNETCVNNTFEWCAEGIEPQIDTLQDLDFSEFATWDRLLTRNAVVVIPNVDEFKETDPRMYWQLSRQGITHLLAVPFYDGDRLLGYLGADNYMLEEDLDSIRVLQTMASFVGARIVNRRLMERVERMARYDELTELPNRHGIDTAISQRLPENKDAPFALALMDIDDFKRANDLYGHELGDVALRTIAQAVRDAFPEDAIVGRNGGDEFLAMVLGEDAQKMDSYLAKLFSQSLHCEHEGKSHVFTMSAGYVCHPEQAKDLRAAYSRADTALYAMKRSGKCGYCQYAPEMETLHQQ